MKPKLVAYAMDFASFLIQKIPETQNINRIILFGSAARGEAEKESDVDIFVDVIKEDSQFEKEIKKCVSDFILSAKYRQYWKLLGIKNEIQLITGNLDKWEELKPSITANGIMLYGKFLPEIKQGVHKAFFLWENVKPNTKRVLFNKQLFGYNQKGKFYGGLLQRYKGERLGKGSIDVPLEYALIFHNLFKRYKITVRIKKVLDYTS